MKLYFSNLNRKKIFALLERYYPEKLVDILEIIEKENYDEKNLFQ